MGETTLHKKIKLNILIKDIPCEAGHALIYRRAIVSYRLYPTLSEIGTYFVKYYSF